MLGITKRFGNSQGLNRSPRRWTQESRPASLGERPRNSCCRDANFQSPGGGRSVLDARRRVRWLALELPWQHARGGPLRYSIVHDAVHVQYRGRFRGGGGGGGARQWKLKGASATAAWHPGPEYHTSPPLWATTFVLWLVQLVQPSAFFAILLFLTRVACFTPLTHTPCELWSAGVVAWNGCKLCSVVLVLSRPGE